MSGSSAGSSFVHLHNHTEYSMLDGAAKITPMLAEVERLGMPAVGMTDHGNMFGASEFYNSATKAGIKPIIGVEAYIAPGSRFDTRRILWGDPSQKADDVSGSGSYTHLTMMAENATGLRNLFKLSSHASFEGQLSKWSRMTPSSSPNTPRASSSPPDARRGRCRPACGSARIGRRSKPRRSGGRSSDRTTTSLS